MMIKVEWYTHYDQPPRKKEGHVVQFLMDQSGYVHGVVIMPDGKLEAVRMDRLRVVEV